MTEEVVIIYSPICRAYENTHYTTTARKQALRIIEISVLELAERWNELKPWMQQVIGQMQESGGFIAAPLVFYRGEAFPAWELARRLEGGE